MLSPCLASGQLGPASPSTATYSYSYSSLQQSAAAAPSLSPILATGNSLDETVAGVGLGAALEARLGAAAAAAGAAVDGGGSHEVRSGRLGDRWERHVTTLAVLMAYTELLLLLCRFPRWGLRVLMFYKVAINVIKVSPGQWSGQALVW